MANADNKDAVRRLSLRFVGEVQGVGFRWTSQRLANQIGLTGWVRNEWDGSVSMELQGTSAQIASFFGRHRLNTPCLKDAFTSSSVSSSPT